MSSTSYEADSDVVDMMKAIVGQHHPDLALVVDEIAIVFREKAAKRGGRPLLGKPAKAGPLFALLGKKDYKFVLELAADEWLELTTRQRNALLDHLLCACRTEVDEKSGDLKCNLAPPDVSFYWDEFDRWGDWRPRAEGDGPDGPSPVEAVFVKKASTGEGAPEEDFLDGLSS